MSNELDQDEDIGGNKQNAEEGNAGAENPSSDQPKPPLSEKALKRKEGMKPLKKDDPKQIGGFTVVGRDPDDGGLLVEIPEREPVVAMSLIKCPGCQGRMYMATSGERLATRSYTVCTNDNCHIYKQTGKRKRGSVERRLSTNIRRFDEIGMRDRR